MGIIFFLMAIAENFPAREMGTNLNGHQTTIPDTLNSRWEKATIIAARFPVTRADQDCCDCGPDIRTQSIGENLG